MPKKSCCMLRHLTVDTVIAMPYAHRCCCWQKHNRESSAICTETNSSDLMELSFITAKVQHSTEIPTFFKRHSLPSVAV